MPGVRRGAAAPIAAALLAAARIASAPIAAALLAAARIASAPIAAALLAAACAGGGVEAGGADARPVAPDLGPDAPRALPPDAGPEHDAFGVRAHCSDGEDNDGDGLRDQEDPGCESPADPDERNFVSDESCGSTPLLVLVPGGSAAGLIPAEQGRTRGSCGGDGAEALFRIEIERAGTYRITTDDLVTAVDTVLHLRAACADRDSEVACNDDAGRRGGPSTLVVPLSPGRVYLFVDGASRAESGPFVVRVTALGAEGDACEPDTSGCEPGLVCNEGAGGAFACRPPRCADGEDDDGDGAADWPADPGCEAPDDNDEADPDPLPACADGEDGDGDGRSDWPADPGCQAAADGDETAACLGGAPALELGDGWSAWDRTAGATTRSGSCGGAAGPEQAWVLRVDAELSALVAHVAPEGGYDSALYLVRDCDDASSEAACESRGPSSAVRVDAPSRGSWFAIVDGDERGEAAGGYALALRGFRAAGAPCDQASPAVRCGFGALCDGGACRAVACADGEDGDGDGLIDAADPGCLGADDDDEGDPAPLPACADGLDNDGDGRVDHPDDPGCRAPSGGSEAATCGTTAGGIERTHLETAGSADGVLSGTTAGGTNQFPLLPCGASGGAPDVVYRVPLPGGADSVHASLAGSGFDTVLYLRSGGCDGGALLGCNDNAAGPGGFSTQSELRTGAVPPGDLWVHVDGRASASGPYRLSLSVVLSPGAPCDPRLAWQHCPRDHACAESAAGADDWSCRSPAPPAP